MIKYHCQHTSFRKLRILYKNYQYLKGLNPSNTPLFFLTPLKGTAILKKSSERCQPLKKILPTKLHKNCCMRLVLTRAHYSTQTVRNFLLVEVNFGHYNLTIIAQIANKKGLFNSLRMAALWKRNRIFFCAIWWH